MSKRYQVWQVTGLQEFMKAERKFWSSVENYRGYSDSRPDCDDVTEYLLDAIKETGHVVLEFDDIDLGLESIHHNVLSTNRASGTASVRVVIDTLPLFAQQGCYRPTRHEWEYQQRWVNRPRISGLGWSGLIPEGNPWCAVTYAAEQVQEPLPDIVVTADQVKTTSALDNMRAALGYAFSKYGKQDDNGAA